MGVPTGVLYWTCEQGLWSPSVGSDESVKQFQKHNDQVKSWTNQAVDYVTPYIQPYVKQVQDKVKIPDVRSYWNCGVRMTFRTMADFDPSKEGKRFAKWVVDQTTSPPSKATPEATSSVPVAEK